MYVAAFSDVLEDRGVNVTQAYEKGELKNAKQELNLIQSCGYPLQLEAIHMIQGGNMTNMPALTAEDMKRAIGMFGERMGSIRGKMT